MENLSKEIDFQNLVSLGNDLIGVLNNRNKVENSMQFVEGVEMVLSSCEEELNGVQSLIEDYKKKISACGEKLEKAKCETLGDAELEHLQNELEEKVRIEQSLRHELRTISDEIEDLEHQSLSLEEKRETFKNTEKDLLRARDLLSMYASVTNIIPNFDDKTRISGFINDRNTKKVDKFDFETKSSPFEVCNRIWKML